VIAFEPHDVATRGMSTPKTFYPGFLQVMENWKKSGNLWVMERSRKNIIFWKIRTN